MKEFIKKLIIRTRKEVWISNDILPVFFIVFSLTYIVFLFILYLYINPFISLTTYGIVILTIYLIISITTLIWYLLSLFFEKNNTWKIKDELISIQKEYFKNLICLVNQNLDKIHVLIRDCRTIKEILPILTNYLTEIVDEFDFRDLSPYNVIEIYFEAQSSKLQDNMIDEETRKEILSQIKKWHGEMIDEIEKFYLKKKKLIGDYYTKEKYLQDSET